MPAKKFYIHEKGVNHNSIKTKKKHEERNYTRLAQNTVVTSLLVELLSFHSCQFIQYFSTLKT